MGSKKQRGMELLNEGYSYREISSELKVAKSTINSWFLKIPEKQKKKIRAFRIKNWKKSIGETAKKKRRETLRKEGLTQKKAAKKIGSLSKRELFLIGAALYWAEGSKSNRWQLQFSNANPKMIALMMSFFRKICQVREEKFYLQMMLHENIDETEALNYWSKIVNVPKDQFKKACYSSSKSSLKKRAKRKLPFGTLQIRVLDKQLTHQIYGYIKGLGNTNIV